MVMKVVFMVCLGLAGLSCGDEPWKFPDSDNFVPQIMEKGGYIIERHYVTTVDGYILELHRTQYPQRKGGTDISKPVVFLMHGLFGSSKGFMYLGPNYAIAYSLAAAGLDVWMGNARGASPSRHHVVLNPQNQQDRRKYYEYSFDEISNYDLPAMIDYALNHTSSKDFHYVGYSLGNIYLLMLMSLQPRFIGKVKTMHMLGCSGSMKHVNPIVSAASEYLLEIYHQGNFIQIRELHASDFNDTKIEKLCKKRKLYQCVRDLRYFVQQLVPAQFSSEAISTKHLSHYGQMLEFHELKSWDFGTVGNLAVYGSLDAITYNFSAIDVPTTIYYSDKDVFVSRIAAVSYKQKKNNTKVIRIADPQFFHVDYLVNNNVRYFVTKYILKTILIYEKQI